MAAVVGLQLLAGVAQATQQFVVERVNPLCGIDRNQHFVAMRLHAALHIYVLVVVPFSVASSSIDASSLFCINESLALFEVFILLLR